MQKKKSVHLSFRVQMTKIQIISNAVQICPGLWAISISWLQISVCKQSRILIYQTALIVSVEEAV